MQCFALFTMLLLLRAIIFQYLRPFLSLPPKFINVRVMLAVLAGPGEADVSSGGSDVAG
jgi:hypothetical protein